MASLLYSSPPTSSLLLKTPNRNSPFLRLKPPTIRSLRPISASLISPPRLLFLARIRTPGPIISTPIAVVASSMARWLDLYSGVLMIRILLSWFPNVPWHKQPFSAIRDLCDPYLNLFRNIVPNFFGSIDLSPLLAFAVLSVLSSLLGSTVTRI